MTDSHVITDRPDTSLTEADANAIWHALTDTCEPNNDQRRELVSLLLAGPVLRLLAFSWGHAALLIRPDNWLLTNCTASKGSDVPRQWVAAANARLDELRKAKYTRPSDRPDTFAPLSPEKLSEAPEICEGLRRIANDWRAYGMNFQARQIEQAADYIALQSNELSRRELESKALLRHIESVEALIPENMKERGAIAARKEIAELTA